MRGIIIEDELDYANLIKNELEATNHASLNNLTIEIQTKEFDKLSNLHLYDLIIIDIELSEEISGIDLIKKVREKSETTIVIFVSSHEEFVFQSFPLQALGFIRKRCLRNDIKDIAPLLWNHLLDLTCTYSYTNNGRITIIPVKDILYIESNNHILNIVTTKENYCQRLTFSQFKEQIPCDFFSRIQRSFMVSLQHIKAIENNELFLDDGSVFTISKIYLKSFEHDYQRYLLCL